MTWSVDNIPQGDLQEIENDTRRISQVKLGAVEGIDTGTRGTYFLDGFVSQRTSYIGLDGGALPPPSKGDVIFSDGFESGNFNAWSATSIDGGHLSVSTASKLFGTYGMQAYINDNTALYMTDWGPSVESHYRAHFQFDSNTINMVTNDAHYFFYALNRSGMVIARIELGKSASGYQVQGDMFDNIGQIILANFYKLYD